MRREAQSNDRDIVTGPRSRHIHGTVEYCNLNVLISNESLRTLNVKEWGSNKFCHLLWVHNDCINNKHAAFLIYQKQMNFKGKNLSKKTEIKSEKLREFGVSQAVQRGIT